MSSTARTPRRRLGLAVVAGLLLVSIGAAGAFAQSASPGTPQVSPVGGRPPVTLTSDDQATPAVPDPAIVDAQPVPFDHVRVAADGRTLTIFYWYGVDGCYGLKDVQAVQTDTGLVITIWAGLRPEAVGKRCLDQLTLYSTEFVLDLPTFTNGGLD